MVSSIDSFDAESFFEQAASITDTAINNVIIFIVVFFMAEIFIVKSECKDNKKWGRSSFTPRFF